MIWTELCPYLNAAALVYGGVTDYRRREIPNPVPAVLLATGILHGRDLPVRTLLTLALAGLLLASERLTKQTIPGGDFKLLCALLFSDGPIILLAVLLCVAAASTCVAGVKRLPLCRSIPLCSYVAPAYVFAVGLTSLLK